MQVDLHNGCKTGGSGWFTYSNAFILYHILLLYWVGVIVLSWGLRMWICAAYNPATVTH